MQSAEAIIHLLKSECSEAASAAIELSLPDILHTEGASAQRDRVDTNPDVRGDGVPIKVEADGGDGSRTVMQDVGVGERNRETISTSRAEENAENEGAVSTPSTTMQHTSIGGVTITSTTTDNAPGKTAKLTTSNEEGKDATLVDTSDRTPIPLNDGPGEAVMLPERIDAVLSQTSNTDTTTPVDTGTASISNGQTVVSRIHRRKKRKSDERQSKAIPVPARQRPSRRVAGTVAGTGTSAINSPLSTFPPSPPPPVFKTITLGVHA